jgi:VanZ family protein
LTLRRVATPRPRGARFWSFRVWPAALDAALILVIGSLPVAPPGAERFSDKTLHCIAFGIFAWLACRAFRHFSPEASGRALAFGFAASVALGGGLELWQALLPYRSSEFLDFVADALGALIAMLITAGVWQLTRAKVPAP